MQTPTIDYFGRKTVEQAVAAYFAKHGLNDQVRDELMMTAVHKPAEFLEMVCDFIERENV